MSAVPIANNIGTRVLADGDDLSASIGDLQQHAKAAASLTSDPIWRAAERVPFVGENLTAFREAAALIDDLAVEALPPLSELSETFSLTSLRPTGGAFDLSVFSAAQPLLSRASDALDTANTSAVGIDTEGTIPQIGSAVDQVVALVAEAKGVVNGLDTAASLLPSMLGADGPRNYLLLSLNNAELRATGGLPGAIAVVEVDAGALRLGRLSTATSLGEFEDPILPLSPAEGVLYGDFLGTFMHDVNYTPDFPRSGELAKAMWLERTGQQVDGVIAVDPVALSYILEATGDIDAGDGITLTPDNATDVLLSEVYSLFAEPKQQDAFFASVTGRIFSTLTSGEVDARTLIDALGRGASENRIHIWSAVAEEQELLSNTPLSGTVPVSTKDSTAFGVYLNDATGAKMGFYLDGQIAIASAVCRNDMRPNFEIKVKLTSSAPLDAAVTLPDYVTGGGVFGVAPGNVSTNVFVYAPEGAVPYSVSIDGQEYAFVSADDGTHSVAGLTVELAPGQASVVSMKFVGSAGASDAVTLQHTPMVRDVETSVDGYLDCGSVDPAPIDGDDEQGEASGVQAPAIYGSQSLG